ncbi:MAG: patatin-like phospholipase family protein [Muribaculaceae bacterium]|nr:patatin-like phospholipase family protein [Muribaculaceae bacterium]
MSNNAFFRLPDMPAFCARIRRAGLVAVSVVISAASGFSQSLPEGENMKEYDELFGAASSEPMPELPSMIPSEKTLPRPKGRESVGLVLSGGGAKGIAHVGVIKALEENDIPIDYVAGTSMGSIVGSLYSCGWSPERMLEFFTTPDFLDWSQGIIDPSNIYYYYRPTPTPQWVSVNLSFKKKQSLPTQIIPTSLISPLPMNIEFLKLFSPYSEQCGENFNQLFVPFRCVASDIYHKHKVVFGKGSLGQAVRASMSFPMVFRPIKIDGLLLYDGGIYDNFPVNVMQEDFDPDFIIGVSVSDADTKPVSGDMYSQLEDMIIQNNDYSLPEKDGVKIQVPVLNFGVLQFDKARTIYQIGYETGLSMVDSIKSRLKARVPLEEVTERRRKFAEDTPVIMFDSVEVKGMKGSPARYLKYLFTNDSKEPFGMTRTVQAYYRAVTDGSLSNLVPEVQFNPRGHNTLVLNATPRRPWTLGVGGYLTTSTNSMLYLTGGYHTMGHNSLDVSLSAWVGQAYIAGLLNAKFALRTHVPSYLEFSGVLSRQKFYQREEFFFKSSNPMFITEVDNFIRMGYSWAIGRTMKGYASIAGGYISDSYYPNDIYEMEEGDLHRDRLQYKLGVLRAGVESNTLDNDMYPSSGHQWIANVDASYQNSRYRPAEGYFNGDRSWHKRPVISLDMFWRKFFPIGGNLAVGTMANVHGTLQSLDQNYTNTKVHATAFSPTPSTQNYFNMAFRSDNFVAAGLIPMWIPAKRVQLRGDFYAFCPMRNLVNTGRQDVAYYDGWFRKPQFLGELALIVNLPFASVSAYGNYLSSPARNWNFGISIGLLFRAPRLLVR